MMLISGHVETIFFYAQEAGSKLILHGGGAMH